MIGTAIFMGCVFIAYAINPEISNPVTVLIFAIIFIIWDMILASKR